MTSEGITPAVSGISSKKMTDLAVSTMSAAAMLPELLGDKPNNSKASREVRKKNNRKKAKLAKASRKKNR